MRYPLPDCENIKIILFAYSQKTYSFRGIEALITENNPAMWLAAIKANLPPILEMVTMAHELGVKFMGAK